MKVEIDSKKIEKLIEKIKNEGHGGEYVRLSDFQNLSEEEHQVVKDWIDADGVGFKH